MKTSKEFKRTIGVIQKIQKMSQSELDAFMDEFVKTLGNKKMNPNKLSFFMQLLLQMDPRLAERFVREISKSEQQ